MWEISKTRRCQIILILTNVNSKCNSEIQLTKAISKNIDNKIFVICARDRRDILE